MAELRVDITGCPSDLHQKSWNCGTVLGQVAWASVPRRPTRGDPQSVTSDPRTSVPSPQKGDWGEISADDWQLNDKAVKNGSRVLSAYCTVKGQKLWIITLAR